jgi:hypothetical protein
VHPEAVFIIIVFAALVIAGAIIVTILRRHARDDSRPDEARKR